MNRIVIKLGTGILTKGVGETDPEKIARMCAQIAEVRRRGIEVLVVSSGAIGMGMGILKMTRRPKTLAKQQACAAIGQSQLIQVWQDGFRPYGITVGQILLTHEGLALRDRYVNAKATIEQMLAYGVVPIINENDTISTYEIRFGNNDLLGAMVASLSDADQLQILSTAPGLVDLDGTGQTIPVVKAITPEVAAMAKDTNSPTAVGGMQSKIQAAQLATESGCTTYIASGAEENIVLRLLDGEEIGTRFEPVSAPIASKKRWLAYFQRPSGSLVIDDGAAKALTEKGRSLLAPGVVRSEGNFDRGDVVDVTNTAGIVVARGQSSLSSAEIAQLLADKTTPQNAEVIHRDSLALL